MSLTRDEVVRAGEPPPWHEMGRSPAVQERAQAASRATRTRDARLLREDVLLLHERGVVPLAIADKVRVTVNFVSRILREAGVELPGYLTTTGPKSKPLRCPHCSKRL